MQLYRYFHDLSDPFCSLTELDLARPQDYVDYIAAHDLRCSRSYDLHYFEARLHTEEVLRKKFIEAGGHPRRRHPYYFVLNNCDRWFYGEKRCLGAISIPLERFDPDTVSFTYGDSVPTMLPRFENGRRYHGQVYTCGTLPALLAEFGWPQQWNTVGTRGYETYIEVQVWDDFPVLQYRPAYADRGRAQMERHCSLLCRGVMEAGTKINVPMERQREFFSVLAELRSSPMWKSFLEMSAQARHILSVRDRIHGFAHAFRCGLYLFAMGRVMDLEEALLKAAILCGLYHDCGRGGDREDRVHGEIGANRLPALLPTLSPAESGLIRSAIHTHCLPEEEAPAIWARYLPPSQMETGRLIAGLLRDADSLDYIRLGIRTYNTRFLAAPAAKELVLCALEANLISMRYPRFWGELF